MGATTPVVTQMRVVPEAGYDSMLMTLSGAHAPYFIRNLVILTDGVDLGEVRSKLESAAGRG